ncbi:YveK family protein [Bacillus sp. FJAT-52991]|uniref:Wzz/FepE/Etk N-terminal domain-containing protein n=1 Tax=Bacillus kandeliae TaxID=3129297 RepID=A0ABZ2N856_9BACI
MHVERRNIGDLIQLFAKKWLIIIAITGFCTGTAGWISFFVLTPVYQATSKVLVHEIKKEEKEDVAASFYQMETSFKLLDTFIVIAESPQVLDKVIKNLDLSMSYHELSQKVRIQQVRESLAIEIIVEGTKPEKTVDIANEISSVLSDEIRKIYGESNVSVIKTAELTEASKPVKPKAMLNMVTAFFAGIVIAIGLIFLRDLFKKLKRKEEVNVDDLEQTFSRERRYSTRI